MYQILPCASGKYFYPRPPRGGRQMALDADLYDAQFLSTPSARRATAFVKAMLSSSSDFYPRPPRGGRLSGLHALVRSSRISIHALREEGDGQSHMLRLLRKGFLSTPSARRATRADLPAEVQHADFYPRPPRGGRPRPRWKKRRRAGFLSTPSARRATTHRHHLSKLMQKFLSTPSARRATKLPGRL